MARKNTKTKPEPTTKHVVISAVAHETLAKLADRYGKSMGEMVALLVDNCYDYGLIQPGEIKGDKHTITTRIDLLEKQLKRTNDANWAAVAEVKKSNNEANKQFWTALAEIKKISEISAVTLKRVSEMIQKIE